MRFHPCPECHVAALATPEERGAIHLDCPVCQSGSVFRDARGGYECTECDQRFLIHGTPPQGYGGPLGDLPWWQQPLPVWASSAIVLGATTAFWLLPSGYWAAVVLYTRLCWDAFRHRWPSQR